MQKFLKVVACLLALATPAVAQQWVEQMKAAQAAEARGDIESAQTIYSKLARQEIPAAMNSLGYIYAKQNQPRESLLWCTVATGYGHAVDFGCLRSAEQKLTKPEIEAVRACEVGQSITVQGQSGPIAQLAIGRPAPKEKLRLTIVLPNNVTLTAPVRLGTGEKVDQGLSLAWRRCLTVGCFADNELPDDQLRRYRMTSEPGRLVFQDGAGRELALPFSFNGLAQALDALARES
jgi:invasion protein IalB